MNWEFHILGASWNIWCWFKSGADSGTMQRSFCGLTFWEIFTKCCCELWVSFFGFIMQHFPMLTKFAGSLTLKWCRRVHFGPTFWWMSTRCYCESWVHFWGTFLFELLLVHIMNLPYIRWCKPQGVFFSFLFLFPHLCDVVKVSIIIRWFSQIWQ